jgi:hypothetical protein
LSDPETGGSGRSSFENYKRALEARKLFMFRKKLLGGVGTAFVGALCLAAIVLAGPADTPVADAAMQGDIDVVRSLLKEGMDVNAAQGDGMTALHWAAFTDNVEKN